MGLLSLWEQPSTVEIFGALLGCALAFVLQLVPRRQGVTAFSSVRFTMGRQVQMLLAVLAFSLPLPASAQTDDDTIRSSSKPRFQVVDGHTVRFGRQLVRLFGIDAPEK